MSFFLDSEERILCLWKIKETALWEIKQGSKCFTYDLL